MPERERGFVVVRPSVVRRRQLHHARDDADNPREAENSFAVSPLRRQSRTCRRHSSRVRFAIPQGVPPIRDQTANGRDGTGTRARLEVVRAAPSVVDLEVRRLEKEARARLDSGRIVPVGTPL